MSAALRLPPSGRHFFVYEQVVLELASTRQAAEEADISQTRVRQIVRRVIEWLGETLPEETELSQAKQLRVGRQIAADRLEAHYREAAHKWRSTEQPKFAGLAIRILAAQVRLPVVAGKYEALMADALEGPLPEEESRSQMPSGTRAAKSAANRGTAPVKLADPGSPPEADCSAAAAEATSSSAATASPSAVASSVEATSDDLDAEARAARAAFFGPAQLPDRDDVDTTLALKITPTELGLTTRRPLSRKERRRRQRALAAK